jgi:hypothetical protein
VSINRGAGYTRISGVTRAKAGDMVMASPNGRARVAYGNGCMLEVEPGSGHRAADDQLQSSMLGLGPHSLYHRWVVIAGGVRAAICSARTTTTNRPVLEAAFRLQGSLPTKRLGARETRQLCSMPVMAPVP